MTKLQKIAFLNLCLAGVCIVLQIIRLIADNSLISLFASTVTLVLGCAMMVSYFRRKSLVKQGGGEYDERDRSIHTTATLYGLMTAFMVSFLTTFLAFLIVGPGGELKIGYVLAMFLLGANGFFFTESAVVLIKYGLRITVGEQDVESCMSGPMQSSLVNKDSETAQTGRQD